MNRKIVITRCKDCPFVKLYYCELEGESVSTDHYFCDGDGHWADVEDLIENDEIPNWCPLDET